MPSLPFLAHPDARALDRFAERDPMAAMLDAHDDRARVARHLARCAACRAEVTFRRELRSAVSHLPEPAPSPDVLARVLAARAQGVRGILPDPTIAPRAASRWRRGALGAAAVAAAVVVATSLPMTSRRGTTPRAPTSTLPNEPFDSTAAAFASDWFVGVGMLPGEAAAQEPRGLATPAPARGMDGTRLRPRTLTFAATWTDDAGHVRDDGRGVIGLDSARDGGRAAWRVHQRWEGGRGDHGERAEAETLLVARDDLRPIARHVHVSPYLRYRFIDVAQRFVADSVVGQMRAEGSDGHEVTRPIAQALPDSASPYITDALAPLFLTALGIDRGWSGRVTSVGWAVVPGDVRYAVALRVVGEERVTVPAGTFDCWRLVVTAPGRTLDYWVRKTDGVGVASRDAVPRTVRGARGVRRIELVVEGSR